MKKMTTLKTGLVLVVILAVTAATLLPLQLVHAEQPQQSSSSYLRSRSSSMQFPQNQRETQSVTACLQAGCQPSLPMNVEATLEYKYTSVCVESERVRTPVTTCLPTPLIETALSANTNNACGACVVSSSEEEEEEDVWCAEDTKLSCTTDNDKEGYYYCSSTFRQELCLGHDQTVYNWMQATGFCGRCPRSFFEDDEDVTVDGNTTTTTTTTNSSDIDIDIDNTPVTTSTSACDNDAFEPCSLSSSGGLEIVPNGRNVCWEPAASLNSTVDELTICISPMVVSLVIDGGMGYCGS